MLVCGLRFRPEEDTFSPKLPLLHTGVKWRGKVVAIAEKPSNTKGKTMLVGRSKAQGKVIVSAKKQVKQDKITINNSSSTKMIDIQEGAESDAAVEISGEDQLVDGKEALEGVVDGDVEQDSVDTDSPVDGLTQHKVKEELEMVVDVCVRVCV